MRARYALPVVIGCVLLIGVCAIYGCGKQPVSPTSASQTNANNFGAALPPKAPQPIDISYIPPDAAFALVVDPYQITRSPNLAVLNDSNMKETLLVDWGIDLDATEQVILIGGLGKKLGSFFTGTILRYKQPFDLPKYLQSRSPEWEEVVAGDQKYYRPDDKKIPCVMAPSNRVLVMADEETLKRMASVAKDAESPLLATLRNSDDAAAALAVLEVSIVRPQVMAFLAFTKLPAPFDAAPYDGIKKVPVNIDEAIVKLNVSPLLSIKADMRAKDEDAAIATDTFLANVIDKIFETVDEMMVEPEGEQDRGAAVAASAIQALLGDLKSILKHSRDGVNLNVSYGGKTVQNQLTVVGPTFMQQIRAANLASQVAQSQEKLIAIAAALIDSAATKGTYPAPAIYGPDGKPLLSWRVQILPLLGQQALYEQFHLDEPWDSDHNKKLIDHMPQIYRTPGHKFDGKTQYVLPTGVGTIFEGKDGMKPDDVTDGKQKTILAVELFDGRGVEWTRPDDLKFDRADPGINLTHLAKPKFVAVFADGVARNIDAKKNAAIMVGLFSPAGGEEIPDEF